MATVISSRVRKIGQSEVYADGGYVVFVSPDKMTKRISPNTFEERAKALHAEAVLMRRYGDRYRDEIKLRVDLANAMMEVVKEARQQVLVDIPIAAINDPELQKEFKKGYAATLYTGTALSE